MIRKFFKTLRLGFGSLLLHKLRSVLAVLGILIGVTAVIWLVAMGEGVSYQAQQQIKDLGATNIIVRSVKPPQESSSSSSGRGGLVIQYGLLRADFKRILSNVPTIQRAVPMREVRREIRNGGKTVDAKLVGCTPAYMELNNLTVDRGRFLEDRDSQAIANIAILAAGAAEELFPYENPIGRTVQIGSDFYRVRGVMVHRTASAAIGGSLEAREYDMDIYIPLQTFRWRIGDTIISRRSGSLEGETVELSQITLTVGNIDQVDQTADVIRELLEQFHENEDYAVVVPKELLRQAELMRAMFRVLLVLIAGISLFVGGIGIMNIMLATVTERTREIGIRRALGAQQSDIVLQFLIETVVLSGVGGILGVLLGYSCPWAVWALRWVLGELLPKLMASLPPIVHELEPRVATWSVVVAFWISILVGVVFGLYPACRAALMDPIEALRHE